MNQNEIEIARQLQCEQLNILSELDRVCKLLGIQYAVAFGTAIGAVRHQGFIPWDDDVDVHMRIEDLHKLQDNAALFQKNFFLQHRNSDPEYGLMITRLRNSNTTLVENTETERDINHGVFVDIYPLFCCPENGRRFKKQVIISRIYRLLLYGKVPQNHGTMMKLGSGVLLKVIPSKMRSKIIDNLYCKLTEYPNTGYRAYLYGDEEQLSFPEKWLFPTVYVPFENTTVPIGCDVHQYLHKIFGDYMKLPPKEKQQFHHDYVCLDCSKSYKEYKGIAYCKERTE